ncbi:TIGR02453 family protein [Ochrobactrum sp. CM-21-5]|nr:TIGR02453 family protein [Ochrobactrum sp. CM-21-5]MBC2885925.1 TIGR02453 family protein [Ochrobactrum sp. CM-21-5]
MAQFNGFGEKAIPFLKALDFHQNREWFLENKDLFEQHLKEPLGDLVENLTRRFEKAGLPFKGDRVKSQFRIKRDTRFSKDKAPYNRHLSALLSQSGTKWDESGCFYVCIGLPGVRDCYACVAWWGPRKELLLAMRKAIAENPEAFRAMVAKLEKNGLKLSDYDRLKRTPRGFEAVTEPDLLDAIRNRHFAVRIEIEPESITRPDLADRLVDFTERARPLLDWVTKIEKTVPQQS